jgi:hypothetical protein
MRGGIPPLPNIFEKKNVVINLRTGTTLYSKENHTDYVFIHEE